MISYSNWTKGYGYASIKDGYLCNDKEEYELVVDDFFIKHYFKLVEEQPNNTPHYYDNDKGSIYLFCHNQKLNSWESDIIKRVVRCRKKGLFAEDLQKTKNLIDLYLKEFNHEK